MKVCFVAHFEGKLDEGVRKTADCLSQQLSKSCQVLNINISQFISWRKITAFRPNIIHYVLSPSNSGIVIAKVMSLFYPKANTIISAPHPAGMYKSYYLSFCKPDLVLSQSDDAEIFFNSLGYKTRFVPSGVDISKFVPVTNNIKQKLRQKYGVRTDSFVILHVASLKRQRNLEIMKKLCTTNRYQVVIVGRTHENSDISLISELKEAGCLMLNQYFPNIEEIYALSDCYLFPTTDRKACIETPLSVLEGMSCNLPVITTRFGALPRMFKERDGFYFIDTDNDICNALDNLQKRKVESRTRDMVLPYSWENISNDLIKIYAELLN